MLWKVRGNSNHESTVNVFHGAFPHCLTTLVFLELPDETLTLLSKSCPDFLEAFDTLVSGFVLFTPQCYIIG